MRNSYNICHVAFSAVGQLLHILSVKERTNTYSHCVKSVQIRSFSGPYFPVFGMNTGKYGPEKTPYLDTFHTVSEFLR